MNKMKSPQEATKLMARRFRFMLFLDERSWIIEAPFGCKVTRATRITEPDYLTLADGACLAERIVLFAARNNHHGLRLVTEHVPSLHR